MTVDESTPDPSAGQPRWNRRRLIGAAAVVSVLITGVVVWLVVRAHTTRLESQIPLGGNPFGAVCGPDPGVAYPDAAAYQGPGPHPISVAYLDDFNTVTLTWQPSPRTNAGFQLVACPERIATTEDHAADCEYGKAGAPALGSDPGTVVPLHHATYRITLRETRTRRKVATLTIVGQDLTCPLMVEYISTKVYSAPDAAQWEAALRPYVTGNA